MQRSHRTLLRRRSQLLLDSACPRFVAPHRARPAPIEALEPRTLLSTWTVNTLNDLVADDGVLSLREAINMSASGDTINFAPSLAGGTIVLGGTQLQILNKDLTISGFAANHITVSGNKASRVFDIEGGNTSLSGLTITNGAAELGAGIYSSTGSLSLSNCSITANAAQSYGGGIYSHSDTLTLTDCTFSHNGLGGSADGGGLGNYSTATLTRCIFTSNGAVDGGGIRNHGALTMTNCTFDHNGATAGGGITSSGTLIATGCTFSNNTADWAGGVLNYGTATLDKCTVSGNSANDGSTGGIRNAGSLIATDSTFSGNRAIESNGGLGNDGTATLTNCTLTGNHDGNAMGSAAIRNNGSLILNDCTVSGNHSDSTMNGGGGIRNNATATLLLYNTIVSGNSAYAGPSDIAGTADPSSSHNLIGTGGGLTNGVNGNIVGVTNPKLRALVDNGGPTLTMSLLSDSPALNAGDNSLIPSGLLYDQRGAGYPRIHDGTVDIGAYELQTFVNHAPVVSVALDNHSPYSGQVLTATARASDSDGDGLTLTYVWRVNGSAVQTTANTTALTDTFNLAVAGHGDAGDTITVEVTPTDSLGLVGSPASDSAPVISAGLVVTTLQDVTNPTDGLTSLREAIDSANPGQTVTFASSLAGGTIVLNGTQLQILNKSVSINGLGANRLTVSGNPDPAKYSRLFYVTGGGLAIDGLTIAGGHIGNRDAGVYGSGGAIYSNSSTVSVSNSALSGNSANLVGGAIFSDNSSTLTITNSTLSGNSGSDNGGGAIGSDNSSTLTITNSTLSGNSSNWGGAISSVRGSMLTITNSTLSGNSARYAGGAVDIASSIFLAYNSIFSGNTVNGVAGDIEGSVDPSSSHNLIGVGGGLTNGVNGNIVGVNDPKLGPLANNGGPTQTMALLDNSPALNAGDNSLIPAGIIYDQRGPGYPRIANRTVNIGAYEADQSSTATTQVSLAGVFNRAGIYANGATFSGSGGLDLSGYALSATLLGSNLNWDNVPFTLGPANTSNIVHGGSGVTVNLPSGQYTSLRLLATAVNGNQPNQSFTVRYTDGTSSTFTQSISDWYTPQNYSGESTAMTMVYRNTSNGGRDSRTFRLYGYNFTLNSAKTVQSLTLPSNANVEVAAVTLVGASGPVVTPGVPTNLTAQASSTSQIDLSWNASSGATSYNLYRSTTPGGQGTTPYRTGITGTSFSDTSLSPNTTYYYKVAAVNTAGTSPQSTEASATTLRQPTGTTTPVTLTGAFNQIGIYSNGTTFPSSGGLDGVGFALSGALLGSGLTWNGNSFVIGPAGANDVVRGGSGVTINLPAGQFQSLQFLATAVNGNQPNQAFVVRYTDGTTTTFTRSISDWYTPQSYSGESTALTMAYRNTSSGGRDSRAFLLYGYSLTLDPAKTIQTLTLPNNANVKVLAVTLVGASGPVVTPAVPTGLNAQAISSSQINLTWNSSSGATSYNLYRSTTPGGQGTTPYRTGITGTSFSDTGLSASTGYYYTVAAVNSAGTSAQSSQASATTLPSTSTTTQVALGSSFNRTGIYANGATFSGSGGLDLGGYALSASLLGSSVTWDGTTFSIGPAGASNVVHGGSAVVVNLPSGQYSTLRILATAVNDNQPNQTFIVRYTDGSTSTFTRSISDWYTPQSYSGESTAVTMAYRNTASGGRDDRTFHLYGYSLTLDPAKTVQSITLPNNINVEVVAMTLVAS